jgi:hypothetical protein
MEETMRTIMRLGVGVALALTSMLWVGIGPALAHTEEHIGPYHAAVGFGSEPAYAGQLNSVQLILTDHDENPVTDLGDTLKVDVGYQDQTMATMTMEPNFEVGEFGTPGDYRAFFFPTRPGTYSFHFTGSIKSQQVDLTVASGPDTFSDVQDPSSVQFPAKDPTTGQVAERLDREIPRLTAASAAGAAAAKDQADSAHTLAVIGVVAGVLGLVLGAAGLIVGLRRGRT